MTRTIILASGKGGTGKTIVTANLGVALAQRGKKTIALDADVTMANLGLMLGLEGRKTTLHDVLSDEKKMRRIVYDGPAGLKVVPCGMSLDGIRKVKLERLKKVVAALTKKADLVLIDSPSGLNHDSVTALASAQELVLVVTPDLTSVSEALKVKIVAERLRVKPVGVVINRACGGDVDLPKDEIENVLELPVLVTMPENVEIRRAAALGESVVVRSPKSPAAKAFKELAAALLKSKVAKASGGE